MKLRNLISQLDIQLSLIIGGIVGLWFLSFLIGAHLVNEQRADKNSLLERERIQLRIANEQTRLLNDLILDHKKSLELTLEGLYHTLNLQWIELSSPGKPLIRFGKPKNDSNHYALTQKYPIQFNGKEYGKISLQKELWLINESNTVISKKWMVGAGLALLLIFLSIRYFIQKQIRDNEAALKSLASQVAHDIRSPLTALSIVNEELHELPENKRALVRSAIDRIQDIANGLLDKKSEQKQIEATTAQLLAPLIESIVSEKRVQYQLHSHVVIQNQTADASAYGIFAAIQPIEFKNVLSNLINNAVESISGLGCVTVELKRTDKGVAISVHDTGCGISSETARKLFKQGASFNKKNGSGLGLFFAKEAVNKWGGEIQITSDIGKGTSVVVLLPEANQPHWFLNKLQIRENAILGVLDDDESIHLTWKERLGNQQKLVHFKSPIELSTWLKDPANLPSLLLVDYEFKNSQMNGLDVIEKLGLTNKSILVTSYSENSDIIQRCEAMKVAILPKAMAGTIPIEVN